MVRMFCGYDAREAIGFHTFVSSVVRRASLPVSITPLSDVQTDGSNAFTYARYSVPALCGYAGWALFADACDMLMQADLAELWALRDPAFAVQVVQHHYRTRHPLKYLGTSMQCPNVDYPRKNWSSLMLINCAAPEWQTAKIEGRAAHQFEGFADDRIGALPAEWNVLADEGQPVEGAKLLHYTAGIPAFPHYRTTPGAAAWLEELEIVNGKGGA